MLARQLVLRRTALSQTRPATQRVIACQIRPLGRQISFLPWRQKKSEPIPVYFANPSDSGQNGSKYDKHTGALISRMRRYKYGARIRYVLWNNYLDWVRLTASEAGRLLRPSYSTPVGKSSSPLCSIPYSIGLMQNGRHCQIRRRRKQKLITTLTSHFYSSRSLSQRKKSSSPHIEAQTLSGKRLLRLARTRSSCRTLNVSGNIL